MVPLGGPARKMSFFQMAPKLFLSYQTYSNRCEYELYEVWFNKIDHIHTYVAAKVIMFFPGCSTVGFLVGKWVVWHFHFFKWPQDQFWISKSLQTDSNMIYTNFRSKKLGGRCPLAVSKLTFLPTNKIPNFTCYLSHICTIQSTRIWNLLSMPNSLNECLKDVC